MKLGLLYYENNPFQFPSYHTRDPKSAKKIVELVFEYAVEIGVPILRNTSFSSPVLSHKGSEVGPEKGWFCF